MKKQIHNTNGYRLTLRCAATIGLFLSGFGGVISHTHAAPQVEFNWQAAPTEQSMGELTLQQAILWAFSRNPQIAQASAQQLSSANYTSSVYQDEYKLSKRSLNDLLSIEQDAEQAETSCVTALYEGRDAAVRYASAVDNLPDMLGIKRQQASGDDLPSL